MLRRGSISFWKNAADRTSVRTEGFGGSNPLAPTKQSRFVQVTWVTVHSEDIGNTFRDERIVDRFEPTRLVVEIPQIVAHEGDEPKRARPPGSRPRSGRRRRG